MYYARIGVNSLSDTHKSVMISSDPMNGFEAAWLGSSSTTISGGSTSFTAYEAYFVGNVRSFTAF